MKRFKPALVWLSVPLLLHVLDCAAEDRSYIRVRGVYGGSPLSKDSSAKLSDYGINAVFLHSGSIKTEMVRLIKSQGASVYAEFNTMHYKQYLEGHPDAFPIGPDGLVSPAPHGWQGVCPTHPGYRGNRMDAFRRLLTEHDVDGVWLDYHHSHASWERVEPALPDTCFCDRCLREFSKQKGFDLGGGSLTEKSRIVLTSLREPWTEWRCSVFTDWVREFRAIINRVKPEALLGTFHCPWTDRDFEGALREKLAIDLKAQMPYVDVFSPMPYHARFGHVDDPQWIRRQVRWLGRYLSIEGLEHEQKRIWPIVQLSDWGETVPVEQVEEVLRLATSPPATGVIVFAWGSLKDQNLKVNALKQVYLSIAE